MAGRSSDPQTRLKAYSIEFPADADLQLKKQIYRLQSLLVRSAEAKPLDVLINSGFENRPDGTFPQGDQDDGSSSPAIASWTSGPENAAAVNVNFASSDAYEGTQALSLSNAGATPVWVRSNEFSAPDTGRFTVSAWVKTDRPDQPLPLRISLEGESESGTYYRFGEIGSEASADKANQAGAQWQRFAVHFDDLPLENLDRLRVGFDLMGPGSVMIDRVEIFDRWFDENDSKAITQLLATASTLLSTPTTYDRCRRLLESYWPRFLTAHFQDAPAQLARVDASSEVEAGGEVEARSKARVRPVSWPIRRSATQSGDASARTTEVENQEQASSPEHSSMNERREAPTRGRFRFRNVFAPRVPSR